VLNRIVARGDASIAQLLSFHYSNGVWTYILATREEWLKVVRGVGEEGWLLGRATSLQDPFTFVRDGKSWRVSGHRRFTTGARVCDWLTIIHYEGERMILAQFPNDRAGITYHDDWDNLGQRLSASGSVTFDNVRVGDDEVLTGLDSFAGDAEYWDGLRATFSQLMFAQVILGTAEGALTAAAEYIRRNGRIGHDGRGGSATDDPHRLRLFGHLSSRVAAGVALADKACEAFDRVLAQREALSIPDWEQATILAFQAKSMATEAALDTTSDIYEATGARSTANRFGLDIYWRNVRTYTVHDSLPYRQVAVGRWVLAGKPPEPLRFVDIAQAAAREAKG
jgi:alkylation response protein AidB-like acyl-CoA dehydrogenase